MDSTRREEIATIDFETRSAADLSLVGAWNYSRHPTTDILCLAYKLPSEYIRIWVPGREFPPSLREYLVFGGLVEAHNSFFEMCIWENIGRKQYGFPSVDFDQWRCSAAKAAFHALPRSLGGACKALDLPRGKDDPGRSLMLKMSKPRKLLKHEIIEMMKDEPDDWETKI